MHVENLAADADTFTSNVFRVDETALVDVGAALSILEQLDGTKIDTVVITHSHHDHIENLAAVVDQHEPTIYAANPENLPVDAEQLFDGDTVALGRNETLFRIIHTPGHRNDHVCLYSPDANILFSGDLIFPGGSFGRTDLEHGDRDTLIESIKRITDLDVHELYAGHGDPTTENVNQQIQDSLMNAEKREPKY